MQRKLYNSTKIDTLLTVQSYMNNVEFHIKTHANCVWYIMNMRIFAIIILYYGFFDMFNVWRGLNPVVETCNLCINWVFIYFSFFIFYYIFSPILFFLFVIYSFNYMTWFLKKCVGSYFALYLLLFILYRKNPSIY